jgi:type I restriction enzyme S subunit
MISIGKLFHIEKGELQSTKCTPGEYDFITAAEGWKTHNEYSHESEALIFAAAASGSLGRTHYVDGKFTTSDLCYILTPKHKEKYPLNLSFYHFVFNSLRPSLVAATKSGTSKESINQTNFKNYEIPYFDIELQNFWIEKLKNTLGLKDLLGKELTHQQTLLKKLRQQILQEAIEGKLTVDWRAKNPDAEPASELLKRIAAEKAQLVKDKKIKAQKPLPPITDAEKPFDLPSGWVWCRLANIGFVIGGLTKNVSKRSGHKIFLPYLRVANVYANRLDLTEVKEIGVANSEIGNLLLEKDDLLVVEGNGSRDQVGRIARWDGSIAPCIHQNHVIKVRLVDAKNVAWILYWYLSPLGRSLVEEQARTSTGLYNLSTGKVSNLALAIPPLQEQQAIVNKVEKLLALCDQLETQITQNQAHAEQLMQAVLREAFGHNREAALRSV